MASSMESTCQSQNPAISSFVSAKGPSVTVRASPSKWTRTPRELGCRPSPASITPASTSSSLKRPMAASSSSPGMTPASLSSVAFTITMTFIAASSFRLVEPGPDRIHRVVERPGRFRQGIRRHGDRRETPPAYAVPSARDSVTLVRLHENK
jgi:hypothetical protein